jgi:L-lactate dehydrogenase complex protein LldG
MTEARDVVLARIREALADAPSAVAVPRDYERRLPADADLMSLFAERVADYRATIHRASTADLPATIAAVFAERGVARIVVPAGFPDAWLAGTAAECITDDPTLSPTALDDVDAVITTCAVAIAETGTIVLDGGNGQGRRALSLLPDRHLCIVDAGRIVGTVPEALERLDPSRPLTWISGPSATSDIELERVEGVHGPRILDVIVIEPSSY